MNTFFVSSVVTGFEPERAAARSAISVMQFRPIMCEDFGARSYSSETACLLEVEQSDVYVLILGNSYGYETPEGISVTHAEYRAARATNKPILAFIKECDMEEKQQAFRDEVEEFSAGYFRQTFLDVGELERGVIQSIRQLETERQADPVEVFRDRMEAVLTMLDDDRYMGGEPKLVVSFLPQPVQQLDITKAEAELDQLFRRMSDLGLAQLQDGYGRISGPEWTGLNTGKTRVGKFDDGLLVMITDPTIKSDSFWSNMFAPPENIRDLANGFQQLIEFRSGYACIALLNMGNAYVATAPTGNSMSGSGWGGKEQLSLDKLFVPLSEPAFREWANLAISRFRREFSYEAS